MTARRILTARVNSSSHARKKLRPTSSRTVKSRFSRHPNFGRSHMQKKTPLLASIAIVIAVFCVVSTTSSSQQNSNLRFAISFPQSTSSTPLDGRLLLLISKNDTAEPRLQINEDLTAQQGVGADTDQWKPGQEVAVDASAFGYPLRSLAELKPGDYWVQGLI